jgi:hypothetical protein
VSALLARTRMISARARELLKQPRTTSFRCAMPDNGHDGELDGCLLGIVP